MAGRPYWSGQFKISLVSFGIQLFPAVNTRSGVTFHQIDRATGQRIRHMNVAGEPNVAGEQEPVEKSEIVKGYEYSKGKYLIIEPGEIEKLRIETRRTIEVQQFVDLDEIPIALFEKPYFVVPDPKDSPDAYAVVSEAMQQSRKAAVGELAFGGREHLVAIAAQPGSSGGEAHHRMMAYLLRYGDELRSAEGYLPESANLGKQQIDKKQLAMASQLIEAYTRPFNLDAFKDDYENALRELVEAKQKNVPLPVETEKPKPGKVINLMDALRASVSKAKRPVSSERRASKAATGTDSKSGPMLVRTSKRKGKAA
ncbi:MAG: Ku protein [Terracidiphilus sp.]